MQSLDTSVAAVTVSAGDPGAMIEVAIDFCRRKTGLADRARVTEAISGGDRGVSEYLHYGLAREIADHLGSVDSAVKAVYLYEPEYATYADEPLPERPSFSPAINLIVCVTHKSAALSAVVDILCSSVAQELGRLECVGPEEQARVVDVQIVDDDEVLGRSGYGALVSSVHVRPMEIWRR